jgi:hypothetical protein
MRDTAGGFRRKCQGDVVRNEGRRAGVRAKWALTRRSDEETELSLDRAVDVVRPPVELTNMAKSAHSESPTVLLRISDDAFHMHRSFNDFGQAIQSAEAFAGAGFSVAMISATGRFLMGFQAGRRQVAV